MNINWATCLVSKRVTMVRSKIPFQSQITISIPISGRVSGATATETVYLWMTTLVWMPKINKLVAIICDALKSMTMFHFYTSCGENINTKSWQLSANSFDRNCSKHLVASEILKKGERRKSNNDSPSAIPMSNDAYWPSACKALWTHQIPNLSQLAFWNKRIRMEPKVDSGRGEWS